MDYKKDTVISINVSGEVFEVKESILRRFPDSILGDPRKRMYFYDDVNKQFFFDRHRVAFEAILFYYQSDGRVICPENVPQPIFEEEMNYFQLKKSRTIYDDFPQFMGRNPNEKVTVSETDIWQKRLWTILNNPESSRIAGFVGIITQAFIMLSISISSFKTVASLTNGTFIRLVHSSNSSGCQNFIIADTFEMFWFPYEMICYLWFTVEGCIRLLVSPDKKLFFHSFINTVDFLTIWPFCFILLTIAVNGNRFTAISIIPLRILWILNVFRILKIARFRKAVGVIVYTIRITSNELFLLLAFGFLLIILGSSVLFYMEEENKHSMFASIPHGFWFSLVTITTIGYGDQYPLTIWGKLVAACCAIFGPLFIALPLFRLAGNFRECFKMWIADEKKGKQCHRTQENIKGPKA